MAPTSHDLATVLPRSYVCTFGCINTNLPVESEGIGQHFLDYHPHMPQTVVQICQQGCGKIIFNTPESERVHELAVHSKPIHCPFSESCPAMIPRDIDALHNHAAHSHYVFLSSDLNEIAERRNSPAFILMCLGGPDEKVKISCPFAPKCSRTVVKTKVALHYHRAMHHMH
jgi:hypothetical protein